MTADADFNARGLLDLASECVRAFFSVGECDGRHSHHQIVGRTRHDAPYGIDHVTSNHCRRGLETVVAHRGRIWCENAAVMVGHAARAHVVEVGLHDRVGGWYNHTKLPSPTKYVLHWLNLPFCRRS